MSWHYSHRLAVNAARAGKVGSSGWAHGECPFCVGQSGFSSDKFYMNTATGGYHCFKCLVRGIVPRRYLPEGWGEGDVSVRTIEYVDLAAVPTKALEPPPGLVYLGDPSVQRMWHARKPLAYCQSRGLSLELIDQSRIAYCPKPQDYRLKDRVLIPILAVDGMTWLGFVGRHWYKDKSDPLPYLNSEGMERESLVYNQQALLKQTDEPCFIVEGAFDVLSLWPNAVALLGKHTESQMVILAQTRRPLVALLDGDAHNDGLHLALRLHELGVRAGSIRLPAGMDPDEVPMGWLTNEATKALEEGPE